MRPKAAVEGGMLPAVYAPVFPGARPDAHSGGRNSIASSGVVVAVNDEDTGAGTPLLAQAPSPIAALPPPRSTASFAALMRRSLRSAKSAGVRIW